ncbi:CGNR zinc finger domain-containing protein [Streptomyces sp. N2-109]|uniref:CGNR zinc finger domain-containing protein n=1 Tax=Streptomyces gossypii TaxID=2883101 RepID=A0ABT2K0D0_9ACTN|nr:CGNR zinc finger domain-containing protein [Streptomyces gossypii]MCT2593627.1 CGNR zinc finger domain-containing protein [Streptomyces gossypii]
MTDRTAPPSLVLAQDLVNTLDIEAGQDALATPEGVTEFLREHELKPAEGAADRAGTAELLELREALRAACLAHTGPDVPRAQAESLARLLSAAPLVLRISEDGSAGLRPAEGLDLMAAITARIAAGIAVAAAEGSWQRLKACQAEDCQWAFYDRSPGGRGRWCTMAVCGSRAKMRAYRARQQD